MKREHEVPVAVLAIIASCVAGWLMFEFIAFTSQYETALQRAIEFMMGGH